MACTAERRYPKKACISTRLQPQAQTTDCNLTLTLSEAAPVDDPIVALQDIQRLAHVVLRL